VYSLPLFSSRCSVHLRRRSVGTAVQPCPNLISNRTLKPIESPHTRTLVLPFRFIPARVFSGRVCLRVCHLVQSIVERDKQHCTLLHQQDSFSHFTVHLIDLFTHQCGHDPKERHFGGPSIAIDSNELNRFPFDEEKCFHQCPSNHPWNGESDSKDRCHRSVSYPSNIYHAPPTATLRRTKNGLSKGLGNIRADEN
jgi:hypothetical protein